MHHRYMHDSKSVAGTTDRKCAFRTRAQVYLCSSVDMIDSIQHYYLCYRHAVVSEKEPPLHLNLLHYAPGTSTTCKFQIYT